METSGTFLLGQLVAVLVVLAMVAADLVFFIIALVKAINTHRKGWIVAASISGLPVLLVVVLFMVGFVTGFTEDLLHSREARQTGKPVAAQHGQPAASAPSTSVPATPAAPKAAGVFIPAMSRVDMVADPKRNLLYITSGDSVLQYQLDSKKFLPPLVLGGDLRGIDISADNHLLAVADAAGGNGRVCIHLVDLQTGKDSPASFTASFQESGTFSVAFGADEQIWISSSMNGSGFLPMRKYNPATHGVQKLQLVGQDTMLAASADRQNIAFAEANVTPGSYGRMLCRADKLPKPMTADGFLYEIGISRDGAQLAVPGYGGVLLQGCATSKLDEERIIAVAYHPQKDYLFLTQAGTSLLSVYDTTTMSKVKELDFGDPFGWIGNHAYQTGRLKLSPDGKYIFCTVNGGIRYTETGL
jgi:hypothetical protein